MAAIRAMAVAFIAVSNQSAWPSHADLRVAASRSQAEDCARPARRALRQIKRPRGAVICGWLLLCKCEVGLTDKLDDRADRLADEGRSQDPFRSLSYVNPNRLARA